ncbi:34184_t:CDS:2 [Gigaspora margarita]|uniref:34184_t:CDS:1 n=1 Tax=Gigaspora margarita TaxID=4874 RepID=A0ABN7W9X3_GIGMA|nr:34184_t:CDS:2 [Gigaspora margarita]
MNNAMNDAINDDLNNAINDAINNAINDAMNDAMNNAMNNTMNNTMNDTINDATISTNNYSLILEEDQNNPYNYFNDSDISISTYQYNLYTHIRAVKVIYKLSTSNS